MQLPKKIIDKIMKWTGFPMNLSLFIDRLFYQSLLFACVGSEKIIRQEISIEVRRFIFGTLYFWLYLNINYIMLDR